MQNSLVERDDHGIPAFTGLICDLACVNFIFRTVTAPTISILVDLILPPLFNNILLDFQVVENSGNYGIYKVGNIFWIKIK